MFSISKRFSLNGSLESQMSVLVALRTLDPIKFDKLYKLGEDLVRFSASGQLRKVVQLVNSAGEGDIFFYFVVKMLHSALINGHLMIATYIVDQSYPLSSPFVPNAIIDALGTVDDFLAVSIIELLVISKGMDVNSQERKSWLTPLHIAVRRGLLQTVNFLLQHNADVNAVADGDLMPLTLAEGLPLSATERQPIIDLLLKSGARKTWRKQSTTTGLKVFKSFSGGNDSNSFGNYNPPTQNSMVSFRGGGGNTASTMASLVTVSSGGSNVTTSATVSTSSSLPSSDLAEMLCGTVHHPAIQYSHGDDDYSTKLVHFSPSHSTKRPVVNADSLAEPKVAASNQSTLDFSRKLPLLKESHGACSVGAVEEVEGRVAELSFTDISPDLNTLLSVIASDDALSSSIEKSVADSPTYCPFQLSDDGAFIFSTH